VVEGAATARTQHRLFRTLAALNKARRNSLCDYQTLKQTLKPRVLSVRQSPRKRTKSSAS
jgi:hypothetical protein